MEPEILHGGHDLSLLNEEGPIPGHPGEGQISKINWSNVPKIRDQNGSVRLLDKVSNGRYGMAVE